MSHYLVRGRRVREERTARCAPRRNRGTSSIWSLGWRTPRTIRRPFPRPSEYTYPYTQNVIERAICRPSRRATKATKLSLTFSGRNDPPPPRSRVPVAAIIIALDTLCPGECFGVKIKRAAQNDF